MAYCIALPPELASAAPELVHDQRFCRLFKSARSWRIPILVLWVARRLGYAWGDDRVVTLAAIRAGFAGAGRPWRIVCALVMLVMACRQQLQIPVLAKKPR
jgi:hypothetical protein